MTNRAGVLFCALAGTAICGALSLPTAAATITVGFAGVVDTVDPGVATVFSPGDTFAASVSYDDATADAAPGDPTFGNYEGAITAALFVVRRAGSPIYSAAATPSGTAPLIRVYDEFPSLGFPATDQIRLGLGQPSQWPGNPSFGALDLNRLGIGLNDNISHDALASDALTSINWNLADYVDERFFFFTFRDPDAPGNITDNESAVTGTLTSIAVVPEPVTVGLALVGIGVLAGQRGAYARC